MPAQGVYFDGHIGEKRQLHQQVVQCLHAVDIEHAVVGVVPGDAPQVAPFAFLLQALRQRFLFGFQGRRAFGVHVDGQVHGHFYVEQHGRRLLVFVTTEER